VSANEVTAKVTKELTGIKKWFSGILSKASQIYHCPRELL
jgi:hypothetical protein